MKPLWCSKATSTSHPNLSIGLSLVVPPALRCEAILAWQLSLADASCEQCSISCSINTRTWNSVHVICAEESKFNQCQAVCFVRHGRATGHL